MGIAIVTGASSGMGKEYVRQISAGWAVQEIWVIARRKERLEELQKEVRTPLKIIAADLSDETEINKIKALLDVEKPAVDMLVNCAGFAKFGSYSEISDADTLSMINLNIKALVMLTDACIPHMSAGGRIIEMASTSAFQPLPYMNVYAASKAFVLSFSRALNREVGDADISVTAVCPGWTHTEFMDVAKKNADANAVKNFMFMSKPENVVHRALKDAEKRREVSIYGVTNKLHSFFAKILPAGSIMTLWNAMK